MALSKTRVNRAGDRLVAWWNDALGDDEVLEEFLVVDEWRTAHAYPMRLCVPGLRNWVAGASSMGIPPAQRLKRMWRIIAKLDRHRRMKLARMQDIGGARAVLGGPLEVEAVAAKIHRYWDVQRVSDYRDRPRPDTGYRALHIMVDKRGRTVEIQLRTQRQHLWAEEIERADARLDLDLKDGEGPAELLEYFKKASDLLWLQEHARRPDSTFVSQFENLREQVRPYFEAKI
jgi:hypothetical protein